MSACSVCDRDLHEGYEFCLHCGATVGGEAKAARPPEKGFADLVDQVKTSSTQAKSLVGSAYMSVDNWLGSPVSPQRQILYSLLGGLALACAIPVMRFRGWFQLWLVFSILFIPLVSYWVTGVVPLVGRLDAVLGAERSLRRRLMLTFLWSGLLAALVAGTGVVGALVNALSQLALGSGAQVHPGRMLAGVVLRSFVGSILATFYLMGFVSYWRSVNGSESHVSLEGMASKAVVVSERIRGAMEERKIPDLKRIQVEMGTLHRLTAGASGGRQGEQLIFICGQTKVVVFVQDFGDSLFVRWTGHLDSSGRRLWLFFGLVVRLIDGTSRRWLGTSSILWWGQVPKILAVGERNHIVQEVKQGGYFARALRLVDGVSQYTWNEYYALNSTVQESVIRVLHEVSEDYYTEERVRSLIQQAQAFEAQGAGLAGKRIL